jgi:hypothetical protein
LPTACGDLAKRRLPLAIAAPFLDGTHFSKSAHVLGQTVPALQLSTVGGPLLPLFPYYKPLWHNLVITKYLPDMMPDHCQ